MLDNNIIITVFTPTYNRADLLKRCFESMKRQSCKQFIWMIIDDGSTDGTDNLVSGWMQEPLDFEIKYYYKENGGLHTAYNEAIAHIETDLCVCIDSDDFMPDNAIEIILSFWAAKGSDKVAGIVGLDRDLSNNTIGDPLPDQETINLIDLLVGKYNIKNGDRTNVVRTELYRKYSPMKSFFGERFFNPHYMHLLISEEYDFLALNENLRYVDYQQGGMSDSMLWQYYNSPNSFAEIRKLYLSFPNTNFKFKLKHSIHLVSSCTLAGNVMRAVYESPCKLITALSIPMGILFAGFVKLKNKKKHDRA